MNNILVITCYFELECQKTALFFLNELKSVTWNDLTL